MIQLSSRWDEHGDSEFLMLGHLKVGEITLCGNGTWVAYYKASDGQYGSKSLRDFPAPDLARSAVEEAVFNAARAANKP